MTDEHDTEPRERDFFDDVDDAYARRKDELAEEHFDRIRRRFADDAERVEYRLEHGEPLDGGQIPAPEPPVDDLTRHVLIIEESGISYVAPHEQHLHPHAVCERVGRALIAFRGVDDVFMPEPHPGAGRYWIDVDEDGNLALGGRISS